MFSFVDNDLLCLRALETKTLHSDFSTFSFPLLQASNEYNSYDNSCVWVFILAQGKEKGKNKSERENSP